MGRWFKNPEHLNKMVAKYSTAWKKRMEYHGLKYYVAVGDHEIGDDPWNGWKKKTGYIRLFMGLSPAQ